MRSASITRTAPTGCAGATPADRRCSRYPDPTRSAGPSWVEPSADRTSAAPHRRSTSTPPSGATTSTPRCVPACGRPAPRVLRHPITPTRRSTTAQATAHREPDVTEPDLNARLNTDVAHSARIYDYLLGGKDNFEADRVAAEEIRKALPSIETSMRANRAFMVR